MAIQRMDNVLIPIDDLEAAKAFFVELGMELEGEATLEGPSVDRLVVLDGVRSDIAMMRTPDDHGRIEDRREVARAGEMTSLIWDASAAWADSRGWTDCPWERSTQRGHVSADRDVSRSSAGQMRDERPG